MSGPTRMDQTNMSKKLLITLMITLIICPVLLIGDASSNTLATPTQLGIYVGPPSVPADNGTYKCVFVQLQDADGKPARAQENTVISLSSSRTEIGTIDSTITIPAGATFGAANFYASFTSGTTSIAAAATGYATVQAQVTTVGPKPYTIAVYGFPATLPADGEAYESIIVQLQDYNKAPARAPKGGTQVFLSCSNTVVGDVTPSVTIPEGQTYAKATFQTTTTAGSATITTIAGDYISSNTTITTKNLAATATKLGISTGPAKVLADNSAYEQIAVQLQDNAGTPVAAVSDITVTIASSDQSIGRTETQITIPQSQTYGLATFSSTYKAGTTTITAAATNLAAASQPVTTTGFTASALAVYCVPSKLAADNGAYQTIQVQLQDENGNPAQAPDTDLSVNLFSSNPASGTVSTKVTIPLGKTCATGTLTATNSPGTTTVTAQASSYTPGEVEVATYTIDFASLHVTVTSPTDQVLNGNDTEITAYVTALGNPISGAVVTFSSDNGGVFTKAAAGEVGYYTTTFTVPNFANTTTCTITASASVEGFIDAQGSLPISVGPTITKAGSTAGTLQLRVVDMQGTAITDALVASTNQPQGMQTLTGITNQTGHVAFKNVTAGAYTFEITKDGYETRNQAINFDGDQLSLVMTLNGGGGSGGVDMLLLGGIIAIFAVVFVVIAVVVVKRRKPAKKVTPLNWPASMS
jgi:hypothetical protein